MGVDDTVVADSGAVFLMKCDTSEADGRSKWEVAGCERFDTSKRAKRSDRVHGANGTSIRKEPTGPSRPNKHKQIGRHDENDSGGSSAVVQR